MKRAEVATTLAQAIRNDEADVYIVNFANCDMVGHTGVIPAAVAAVEAVDSGVETVIEAVKEKGGFALLPPTTATPTRCSPKTARRIPRTRRLPFLLRSGGQCVRRQGPAYTRPTRSRPVRYCADAT